MSTCHSKNQCISVYRNNIPGARQFLFLWIFVSLLIISFLPCSDNCQNFFFGQINFPDCMILCVAQIKEVFLISVNMTYSLRVVEACLVVSSINEPYLTSSDSINKLMGFGIHYHKSVITCVWNHKKRFVYSLLFLDANTLAWKLQILGFRIFMNLSLHVIFVGRAHFSIFL